MQIPPATPRTRWRAIALTPHKTARSVFFIACGRPESPMNFLLKLDVPDKLFRARKKFTAGTVRYRNMKRNLKMLCGLLAMTWPLAAVFIFIAIIVDASSIAIPGSAHKPRPAAAKRRFARGSGAQSQSKKASCGERQGVYRRGFVGTERPRRFRGWRCAEEGRAARAANWSGWRRGREQRRVLARARAGGSGPNRRRGRGDGENEGRHQEVRQRRF